MAVSFFLTIIMLGSTVGYIATKHVCGGKVVLTAVSLTQKKLSCGMQKKQSSCPKHKKLSSPCCSNEHELNQLEDNFNPSKIKLPVEQKLFMNWLKVQLVSSVQKNWVGRPEQFKAPPDRVLNYTKWFQVFRI